MTQVHTVESLRIDDICRTERYYTATLLPYVLFHESFTGLKKFLKMLEHKGVQAISVDAQKKPVQLWQSDEIPHNIEIITEMDVVRDVKFYSNWLPGLERINIKASEVRPDVVIIANNLLLVIEGKFFHNPTLQNIKQQVQDQRKVIENTILPFPGYSFNRYCQIFLSAETEESSKIGCNTCLSWKDIADLAEQTLGQDHYVTQRIRKALLLYNIINAKNKKNYIGKEPFAEIIKKCQTEGDRVFIGHVGGVKKLESADANDLTKKQFKWDWSEHPIPPKIPNNWIKGNKFLEVIKKYFPKRLFNDDSKKADKVKNVKNNLKI